MKLKLLSLFIMLTKLLFYGTLVQVFTFSILIALPVDAQIIESIKDKELTLNLKNASLLQAFNELEENTGYEFTYDRKILKSEVKLNLVGEKLKVYDYLLLISKEANLHFRQYNNSISVSKNKNSRFIAPESIISKAIKVSGTIISSDDEQGLPGVNVVIKGTSNGTVSDMDGNFSIDIPSEETVLIFSSIGYMQQEVLVGNQTVFNITMESDITSLSEVIVTAFGIEREKKALAYSAQELKGEVLTGAKEVSIANYLTGNVAGVQVSNAASGLGGSTNVTIRGTSSLGSTNQPLYVVDGVPIINQGNDASANGLWGGNDYGDGISNINPDDVESITVLKGPAASALYGSRGANGVIVITTKSGKAQKGIGVEFNSTTSIQTLNLFPTTQNKYGTGYEGTNMWGGSETIDGVVYETVPGWHGDSWGPPLDGRRIVSDPFLLPDEAPRTLALLPQDENNIRDFYQTGVITNNMVSINGGVGNTTARLSFGNTYNKGIIPNSSGVRNTINLRVSSKVTDKLSFDSKVNYSNSRFNNRPNLGGSYENVTAVLQELGRYVPLDFLKKDYEITGSRGNQFPGVRANPYYIVNELTNNDERNRMIGFASLRYEFTNWLSLSVRTGIDSYSDERQKTWPVGASWPYNDGRLVETTVNSRETNSDFLLTANGDLSDNIAASFSVGGNLLKQYTLTNWWDARDFKVPGINHVSNAQDIRPFNRLREKEIQSLYAMGQLAYKNYLFLDITGRNDWSSTLGANNLSFFYPSIGLGFVFTDAFELSSNILTFGKIRASWAQVGNDSDPYLTTAAFGSFTTTYNGQGYANMPTILPNLNLQNELTESIEVGFDVRLFENRIGLDMTYYDANTTNQILTIPLSNSSGYQNAVINAGKIRNSGIEITLNAGIINSSNGFNWNLAFNYASNRSEVVELAPGIETMLLVNSFPNDIEARPGEEFGDIIGYKYKRSPDGRRIVGPGGGYEREDETSILGNITPDWIGGLNNSFSYKGIFMNVLVDFVQGGEISSLSKYQMTAKGTGLFTEEGRRLQDTDDNGVQLPYVGVLDGVVEILDGNGDVTGYAENTQAVDGQTYWGSRAWTGIGEEFILDASYITLRELVVGYNFNLREAKKSPFTGIRVSLIGRNLLYFEEHMENMGISPESAPNLAPGARGLEQRAMPTTRTWGVNINLTF